MKNNLKIQSCSDIITNSSSEVFMFNSELSFDEIYKMLDKHINEHWYDYEADPLGKYEHKKISDKELQQYNFSSGDGGDWSLEYNRKLVSGKKLPKRKNWYAYIDSFEENEGEYQIMVDHSAYATINWIKEKFDVIKHENW